MELTLQAKRNNSAIATSLIKAGFSSEFAQGFDEILTSDDLEFLLDDLLFENPNPDLVTDFLGNPIDTFEERNIDDLISDLLEHPLVKGEARRIQQDQILDGMGPGKLDKEQRLEKMRELTELSKEQEDNFENSELVVIYRTRQDGRVDDTKCLPLEGEVYAISDPERPIIPRDLHPGCRCFYEDAVTGVNLGQF